MVKVISDSTCDLSQDLLERYGIGILPLHIILGEKDYEDGRGITPEEIYRWSDETRQPPKTAAVTVESAAALFEPLLKEEGAEIVAFAISESMSSTANAMRLAAQHLGAGERVFVVDSQSLSTGVGLLVIEAAILARQGLSGAQIARRMEDMRVRVRASFVVDTLAYLHRGGRCSGAAALVGSTLRLHPRIVVSDGRMSPEKKYRGRISRAIQSYVEDMRSDLLRARRDRVFITHSGCAEEDVEWVRQYLADLKLFSEIHITRAGGVVSSHCGPGTLGVLFIAE